MFEHYEQRAVRTVDTFIVSDLYGRGDYYANIPMVLWVMYWACRIGSLEAGDLPSMREGLKLQNTLLPLVRGRQAALWLSIFLGSYCS